MAGPTRINPNSGRKKVLPITGGVLQYFNADGSFLGNRFNVFQIYNDSSATMYIGTDPGINASGEGSLASVVAGGAIVLSIVGGTDTLYLRNSANGSVRIFYFYEENLTSNSLYQTLASVIVTSGLATDVQIVAEIPAGTQQIGLVGLVAGVAAIGTVEVTALPPLPAGTNNIGDMDILSVIPGVGATNLGKAEDAAHASGDVGVMALAVRQDVPAAIATASGDYAPVEVDALGRQYIANVSSSGAGTITLLTLTTADTEYTVNIPAGTRKVEFTARSAAKVPATSGMVLRMAWASGVVAAGTGACKTFTADKEYVLNDHIFATATAIYFASATTGMIVEMVSYS